tara:strand:+ start:35189 stop:35866 length:678 start_codon:yes stop_codon:yes gene_type:complete
MSFVGLQTYIFFKFNFLFKKKFFLSAAILGVLLPEIDSILISIYYLLSGLEIDTLIFDKNVSHSFITLSLIYLLFLIFYEIKKKNYIINFARGVMVGMTSNIIFDIIIRTGDINIFWPLPIITFTKINYSIFFIQAILILEFIFIRLACYVLIENNLTFPVDSSSESIKYFSLIMKIQSIFVVTYSTLILFFKLNLFILIFLSYITSLLFFILILYKNKKIFKTL